jgi:hypothetical protein
LWIVLADALASDTTELSPGQAPRNKGLRFAPDPPTRVAVRIEGAL